jgi:5-methyltetrahydrofolate--homocysteine methyltransferase
VVTFNTYEEEAMSDYSVLKDAMKRGKLADVRKLVEELLAAGAPAQEILNNGLLEAMGEVGQRFKRNEVFVPEVLVAARAMKAGTELLKPHLTQAGVQAVATAIMGTVKGDLHDIGKNLVIMMLEGAGFAVVDAGVDVAPERFVELAREHNAKVVGLSALLTTTMPGMRSAVDALRASGLPVKVMVGGAPVTQAYSDEIGADGYSVDAASAAELASRLIA